MHYEEKFKRAEEAKVPYARRLVPTVIMEVNDFEEKQTFYRCMLSVWPFSEIFICERTLEMFNKKEVKDEI